MNTCTSQIVNAIKEIVDRNGKEFLYREPYKVYRELKDTGVAESNVAGALFCVFACEIRLDEIEIAEIDLVSKKIQGTCYFNNKMADDLAEILCELFSDENEEHWIRKEREGLEQFLQETFICKWNGIAVWQYGSGSVDCHYDAEIILNPTEQIHEAEELSQMLNDNPFLAKKSIRDYYVKNLENYLDRKFDYYCTCDDYYQPVVEDFEIEYYVKEWCIINGFEYHSLTGEGYDDGYEPEFYGW